MKKRSLIALLLCIVLVAGLFTGCGKKDEPVAADPIVENKEPAKEETPAEETPVEQTPAEETARLPLVKDGENVTLTIGVVQSSKVEDYNTNEYTLWLEEQTGIDLEFVYFSSTTSEYVTQLSLMVAGGEELPDILWNFGGLTSSSMAPMYEYGEDGYFVDLAPYFETDAYYWNEAYEKLLSEEGSRSGPAAPIPPMAPSTASPPSR